MKILEFRIVCPTNIEKYRIGNHYMVAQKCVEETSGGEGIEILKNEPFDNGKETGQYTHKIFHFKSRIPGVIRWAIPDKYCHIHEKSYNAYPHYDTINDNPGMGDCFIVHVESQHIPYNRDEPFPDNLVGLAPDELAIRQVIWLDLLNSSPIEKNLDLHGFVCPEGGIKEPLTSPSGKCDESKPPDWTTHYNGEMMVAVKTVRFKFQWRGLQTAVEKFGISTFHNTFLQSHRSLISWAKDWYPMNIDQIREMEDRIQNEQKNVDFEQE